MKGLDELKSGYGLQKLCPGPEILIPEAKKMSLTQKKFNSLVIKFKTLNDIPTDVPTPV
jgi:hypothetical protein